MNSIFIYPETGGKLDASVIDPHRQRFWLKSQLRKDGLPYVRKSGYHIGVTLRQGKDVNEAQLYDFTIGWVPFDESTEQTARIIRQKLDKAYEQVRKLRVELIKFYHLNQKPLTLPQ